MSQDDAPASSIDPAVWAARRSSFGGQAEAYAQTRPSYPSEAVRWALAPVTDRVRAPRVLDLAAGTGKLTEALLRTLPSDAEIVAVEPDADMLAQFRRLFPQIPAEIGAAESIPLPDGVVDAIVVGQAMHWFDLERALPEMARVLAPGGVLGALWNVDDDRVPWVRELRAVTHTAVSMSDRVQLVVSPENTGHFNRPEHADFSHPVRRTAQSYVDSIATHSHLLVLSDADRAAVLDRVLTHMLNTPETRDGEFDMPMVTSVFRATLTSGEPGDVVVQQGVADVGDGIDGGVGDDERPQA